MISGKYKFKYLHYCHHCDYRINPNSLKEESFFTDTKLDDKTFWRVGKCPICGSHIRFQEEIHSEED